MKWIGQEKEEEVSPVAKETQDLLPPLTHPTQPSSEKLFVRGESECERDIHPILLLLLPPPELGPWFGWQLRRISLPLHDESPQRNKRRANNAPSPASCLLPSLPPNIGQATQVEKWWVKNKSGREEEGEGRAEVAADSSTSMSGKKRRRGRRSRVW